MCIVCKRKAFIFLIKIQKTEMKCNLKQENKRTDQFFFFNTFNISLFKLIQYHLECLHLNFRQVELVDLLDILSFKAVFKCLLTEPKLSQELLKPVFCLKRMKFSRENVSNDHSYFSIHVLKWMGFLACHSFVRFIIKSALWL